MNLDLDFFFFSYTGTEFEDTDSECEMNIEAKPSSTLKFANSNGSNSPMSVVSSEDKPSLNLSEKGKIITKTRKYKKFKSAKENSQELQAEASDDDLWRRRRSERIFLHGSVSCPTMLSAVNTNPSSVSKAIRYNKLTSSKKGKEQNEKVSMACLFLVHPLEKSFCCLILILYFTRMNKLKDV